MRKYVLSGVILAAAAVAAGLYLSHTGRSASAQTIALDSDLVALLPADATTLVGVDVERLKRTTLYRHIEDESQKQGNNHFDEFTAATGFDPRRDVQDLLMASWTAPGMPGADTQFVAVARGQFNVAAIGRELRAKKAKVESYRGFEVFSGPDEPSKHARKKPAAAPSDPGAFAFLNDKTVLAGTRPAVLGAIDRKISGGASLLDNTALLGRAQTISGASQVWAISQNPGDVVARALPKDGSAESTNFARIFSSMQNSTFALDLMNGLDLKAAGICKTPEDAKTLGDAARGFIAFGRLAASQKEPEMMTLLDGIHVEERNTELNITVQVAPAALEKLLEKTRSRAKTRNVSYQQ